MSILIKGLEKPTDCGLCPFEDFGYCNVKGERNTSESGIDTDCPLIEVADRKTENSSEIPNNCEECKHWNDTEDDCADRHGCKTTEDLQDWKDKMWAEAIVTEPTTEDCSTVDKDINVRSKDEPQTEMPRCSVNGTPFDECGFCEYFNCDTCKCEADVPQTERIKTPDYCDICNHKGCGNCTANNLDDYCVPSGYEPITKTETQNSNLGFEKPQTERSE